jgi:hypothetical protein
VSVLNFAPEILYLWMDYPFDTVGLCSDDIDRFDTVYKALRAKFNIQFTGHINFHLEDFEVFKQYQDVTVRDSYVIKHMGSDCYILFVEAHNHVMPIKSKMHDQCEYNVFALAYLKKDFGRIMIRPETLRDKLLELIHPIELDFDEDKAFSDTFYVLVADHQKAVSAIDRNFRNAVMDLRHEDFVIEIVNHALIISNYKPVSPEKSIYLAEFVTRLCSMC